LLSILSPEPVPVTATLGLRVTLMYCKKQQNAQGLG
jgi:hypothetical protein